MVSIMENDTKRNLKEASEWLGISLNTLKKRMDELQIDTVVDGKKKLISSEDLQRLKEISQKQKTIKMTDSIDGELVGEIKNLRERLEKVESQLINSQSNSQMIDILTERLLEQSRIIDSLKKLPSVSSQKPRQRDLTEESTQSVAKIEKTPRGKARTASEGVDVSQKPMKINAAIKVALQRMYPDGDVPDARNGIPLEVKGEMKEKMKEILLELTGEEVTDRQLGNSLYKLRKQD